MADELRLASDEYVIAKYDESLRFDVPDYITDEDWTNDLTLTNKRIVIHTSKARMFKPTIHRYDEIPLSAIKVIDNRVQALTEKTRRNGYLALVLYLTDGSTATFQFQELMGKTPKLWASEIARVLVGSAAKAKDAELFETTNAASAIPYAEDVAKAVSGTVDVFRSAFRRSRQETAPVIEIYCSGCGAKTTIKRGETKYCQYCGNAIVAPPA